jgi:hypothetical protein
MHFSKELVLFRGVFSPSPLFQLNSGIQGTQWSSDEFALLGTLNGEGNEAIPSGYLT